MTGVILQARLDSSRLPQKALLNLSGEPIIVRVMQTLKTVPADIYVLACDTASEAVFAPLAESCGFRCIGGPKDDVLERFCSVIRKTGITTVIRATGDNPFLFADAASASVQRFNELQNTENPADYFTYTGLPHGSGIEVYSSKKLLEAAALTDVSYEREHVGPSLYKHPERFSCIFETAPSQWYYPGVRTTIDTREDYERTVLLSEYLDARAGGLPTSSKLILEAWNFVTRPVLFIPSTEHGGGTGHIRRLVSLIKSLKEEWRCLLYIPRASALVKAVPPEIKPFIISDLPVSAHLVILDHFRTDVSLIKQFRKIGPVVAIDEGGRGRSHCDYLLDIIPGLHCLLRRSANLSDISFLPLPTARKKEAVQQIRRVLVVAGGENDADLITPVSQFLASLDFEVTSINPHISGTTITPKGYTITGLVENLREKLCHYDLVVTHYGFTAFEALAAGCRVILFSPTWYHYKLSRAYGFSSIPPKKNISAYLRSFLSRGIAVPNVVTPETKQSDLASAIRILTARSIHVCPLCGSSIRSKILLRSPDRTVVSCSVCSMVYPCFLPGTSQTYKKSYFFEEYRNQYGKTYLEDFDTIRIQGLRRFAVIEKLVSRYIKGLEQEEKNLLDIGCAYGPFLSVVKNAGWNAFGTDISPEAVEYVQKELHITAWVSAFPAPDRTNLIAGNKYAVISLWYVIEHFQDLEPVFERIRTLLIPGGLLSFSTPSGSGISAQRNLSQFLQKSPVDHFTVWRPQYIKRQLMRYGFSVVRIVYTGHHPERFPGMEKIKKNGFLWRFIELFSKLFSLGDTFEVYAIKNGTLEDIN